MRDLAAEFANISEAVKLPEQSTGYQRKAQTMLGYQQASYVTFDAGNLPVGSTASLSAANGDRAVVLTSQRVRPPRRQQHHRPAGEPGREQRAAVGHRHRQRHRGQPRHRRDRRDHQHGGAGHRRDQRQHGGVRARAGAHVPHEHRQRRRRAEQRLAAERPPARSGDRAARPDRPDHAAHRQARATAPRSACSSTARSTATRSRPRASASRPRSGCCATTGPIPRPRS